MKSVRNVTPLAEIGGRELRRLAYEGAPEDIAMLSDLAQTAEELNLLGVFQKCYAQKSAIVAEAQQQSERVAALRKIQDAVRQFGLRSGTPIRAQRNLGKEWPRNPSP
jgi:hypothetical protein